MGNLNKIIYFNSDEDIKKLIENKSFTGETEDGQQITVVYNENDIYVSPSYKREINLNDYSTPATRLQLDRDITETGEYILEGSGYIGIPSSISESKMIYVVGDGVARLFFNNEADLVTIIGDHNYVIEFRNIANDYDWRDARLVTLAESSLPKQRTFSDGQTVITSDNTEYRASGDISTLNIVFGTTTIGAWVKFKTADSGTITITLPLNTQFLGSVPTFENSKTYELSVKDGLVAWGVSA